MKIVITLILFITLAEFVFFTEPAITAESPLLSDSVTKSDNNNEKVKLEALVKEALENNPEIKTAIAKWQGTAKRPSQESALPNPEIGISYKNVSFNKLTLGDDDFTELSVYASQEIPFPGKLSLKGKIAKEETEAEKNLADAVVRTVVADLKKAYYDWYLVNKSIEITSKNKELIEKFTKISEAKYEVGKGIQQDVIRAQLEVSVFLERLELLKRQKEIIEAKIRSLLNRSSNSPLGIPENIQKSKLKLTLDDLYKLAGNQSPMLNAKKNLIEKSGKALELAKKQYLPDFVGEFGWFSRGEFTNRGAFADEWVARVGFIVPIYFWKKERFGVEEASYKLEEMKQDYNSTNQNLNFEIKEKYITAKTSEKLLDLYQNGIIPQSTLSRESAISGYRVGDVDFLTLIDSSVAVFNFELEYIKQLVEYEKALAGLEEIVGYDLKSLNNEVIK